MAEKKAVVKPFAELLRGRRASESERRWAETTLTEALARQPEKPIGAATGTNLDEDGGGTVHDDLGKADPEALHAGRSAGGLERGKVSGISGRSSVHARDSRRRDTGESCGRCGSSQDSPRRRRPTSAISICWSMAADGLSVAFDLPTLMGYDSDHAFSEGEVGKCGVAIDSLEDMEILFRGIDLEKTTVSMTINSPASALWAMYLVVAEKQGADWKQDFRNPAE